MRDKKILFIGHFLEKSGWGQAARDYILAMDSVGLDIVCRPIRLGAAKAELSPRINELMNKSSSGAEVCIQHVLPHHLVRGDFKKNICIYATETSSFAYSGWVNYINLMDSALVISEQSRRASVSSGVKIPVKILPHACNPEKYNVRYKKLYEYEKYRGLNAPDYLFYFIGELTQRKNIPALVRAFHLEFDPSEPVNLLLKVNSSVFSNNDLYQQIQGLCSKIKEELRLYPVLEDYKRELILTEYLDTNELMGLHEMGDCFVSPSYGEAWSIPTFDAAAMGKQVIATRTGGMADYLRGVENAELVDSFQTPVGGVKDTFSGLFTGREEWDSIDVSKLRCYMRVAYNRKETYFRNKSIAKKYSYTNVGEQLRKIIDE